MEKSKVFSLSSNLQLSHSPPQIFFLLISRPAQLLMKKIKATAKIYQHIVKWGKKKQGGGTWVKKNMAYLRGKNTFFSNMFHCFSKTHSGCFFIYIKFSFTIRGIVVILVCWYSVENGCKILSEYSS